MWAGTPPSQWEMSWLEMGGWNYIANQHILTLTRAKATLGKGEVGNGKQQPLAALPMERWESRGRGTRGDDPAV